MKSLSTFSEEKTKRREGKSDDEIMIEIDDDDIADVYEYRFKDSVNPVFLLRQQNGKEQESDMFEEN